MKNAYMVVSDLHLSGHSKINRYNYDSELHVVFHKIVDLLAKYVEDDCETYIVFLGDIFDKSYKSPAKYGIDASFFFKLKTMTKKLYSVVGNHEINFYTNNPYWTLVAEIKSSRLNSLRNINVQPLGYEDVFEVVDRFTDGECVFHFNHFGCPDSAADEGKINIAFYHKALYGEIMVKDAERRGINLEYARSGKVTPIDVAVRYNYVFLGHMHWLYGTYRTDDTIIYGLSSLGRPAKSEVDDKFLERDIPVIIVENGRFSGIENNKFLLPSRKKSVIAEIDEEEKVKYEIIKARNEAKTYVSAIDNPIQNIKNFIAGEGQMSEIFNSLVNNSYSDFDVRNKILDIERRSVF